MSQIQHIVAACGGDLFDGGRRALIPGPNHSPRDRSVSLLETDDGRILIHCFSSKDDWRHVRAALADKGLLDESSAASRSKPWRSRVIVQQADEDRTARARRWWEEGHPIAGTAAEVYLRQRAITAPGWNAGAVRFHPRVTSLDDRERRPALLAALLNESGRLQGVQVTLLSEAGNAKASVDTPRRVIGKLLGGAVRMHLASDTLLIAGGFETAFSASSFLDLPCWALLAADNLARFTPPTNVRRLVIAQDNDHAGEAAAAALTERLSTQLDISIRTAPGGFNDWNDWAREEARRG